MHRLLSAELDIRASARQEESEREREGETQLHVHAWCSSQDTHFAILVFHAGFCLNGVSTEFLCRGVETVGSSLHARLINTHVFSCFFVRQLSHVCIDLSSCVFLGVRAEGREGCARYCLLVLVFFRCLFDRARLHSCTHMHCLKPSVYFLQFSRFSIGVADYLIR